MAIYSSDPSWHDPISMASAGALAGWIRMCSSGIAGIAGIAGIPGMAGVLGMPGCRVWGIDRADCSLRQGARHLKGTYKGDFVKYFLMIVKFWFQKRVF